MLCVCERFWTFVSGSVRLWAVLAASGRSYVFLWFLCVSMGLWLYLNIQVFRGGRFFRVFQFPSGRLCASLGVSGRSCALLYVSGRF